MVDSKPLREFYITARKEAKITVNKLEQDSGLNRNSLKLVEDKKSNSIRAMLIGLETLGYVIDIT
jgi:hypothetical protein